MGAGNDGSVELGATAAGSLYHQAQVEEELRALVLSARDTIPGAEQAGVSVAYRGGQFHTAAATGSVVYQADHLQYRLDEGPVVAALHGEVLASTGDLAHDTRWPRYAPRGARLGIASQLGLRLFASSGSVAGLNLYSSQRDAFGPQTRHVAGLFVEHAAYALGRTATASPISDALGTRRLVGHAVGIVMERHRLTEQEATAYLLQLSRDSGTRLGAVSAQLIGDLESAVRSRPAVGSSDPAAG